MEIKIAEICGLCSGCRRAINRVIDTINDGKNVTIFKEIVHNKNTNNFLLALGARTENDIDKLTQDSIAIIRGHGEPPSTYDILNKKGVPYLDCTCPNVENIHNKVKEYSLKGYEIIILGKYKEKIHPEVEGTIGWAQSSILIQDESDLTKLNDIKNKKLYLICQTTFNISLAEILTDKIEKIAKQNNCEIMINKSMCTAQREINKSSLDLAKSVDVMIVVGGKNSSNTKELYNNLSTVCPSIFIEDIYSYKDALKNAGINITKDSIIGLTAGASTMREELLSLKKVIERDFNK